MGARADDSRSPGQRVRRRQPEGCPGTRGMLTVSCWSFGSISLMAGLPRAGEGPAAGREGMAGCGQELPAPCYPGGRPVSPAPHVTSPGSLGPSSSLSVSAARGTAYVVLRGAPLCRTPWASCGVPA